MKQYSFQKPNLRITGDGSHTLYSNRFDQHYHNPNGAVAEGKHNFFEVNGLYEALKNKINCTILEVGFGTGLNLLLLMDYLQDLDSEIEVVYHTIEGWPISAETAASLNFAQHLHHPRLAEKLPPIFDSLEQGLNKIAPIPGLDLSIFYGLFENYSPKNQQYDFIFHDAFSPRVNPDLWTGKVFKKLYEWSQSEAVVSTYCAASKARGAMAWAGWKVARAPGAVGKREMTVGSPSTGPLAHLKRVNEERLAYRYEEGDFGKA